MAISLHRSKNTAALRETFAKHADIAPAENANPKAWKRLITLAREGSSRRMIWLLTDSAEKI